MSIPTNTHVSCDICKFGELHDYVKDNYYCNHKDNPRKVVADAPILENCPCGEIDEWKYNFKCKHSNSNKEDIRDSLYDTRRFVEAYYEN